MARKNRPNAPKWRNIDVTLCPLRGVTFLSMMFNPHSIYQLHQTLFREQSPQSLFREPGTGRSIAGSSGKSRLRHSPRFPTLPANLGEHTCCLCAFSPIPSTESNSDIPSLIASISAPSPQTKSAYWGCLRKTCPNLDFPCFATCALANILNRRETCTNEQRSHEEHSECWRTSATKSLKALPISGDPKTKAPPTPVRVGRRSVEQPSPEVCSIEG